MRPSSSSASSTRTSTMSPVFTRSVPSSSMNSQVGIRPSDLKPMSTCTLSRIDGEHGAAHQLPLLHLLEALLEEFGETGRPARVRVVLGHESFDGLLWGLPALRVSLEFPVFRPRIGLWIRSRPRGSFSRAAARNRVHGVGIAGIERPRELGEARGEGLQGARERLAIEGQDLAPQLGVAARDAREVAKARPGQRRGAGRRIAERRARRRRPAHGARG